MASASPATVAAVTPPVETPAPVPAATAATEGKEICLTTVGLCLTVPTQTKVEYQKPEVSGGKAYNEIFTLGSGAKEFIFGGNPDGLGGVCEPKDYGHAKAYAVNIRKTDTNDGKGHIFHAVTLIIPPTKTEKMWRAETHLSADPAMAKGRRVNPCDVMFDWAPQMAHDTGLASQGAKGEYGSEAGALAAAKSDLVQQHIAIFATLHRKK